MAGAAVGDFAGLGFKVGLKDAVDQFAAAAEGIDDEQLRFAAGPGEVEVGGIACDQGFAGGVGAGGENGTAEGVAAVGLFAGDGEEAGRLAGGGGGERGESGLGLGEGVEGIPVPEAVGIALRIRAPGGEVAVILQFAKHAVFPAFPFVGIGGAEAAGGLFEVSAHLLGVGWRLGLVVAFPEVGEALLGGGGILFEQWNGEAEGPV